MVNGRTVAEDMERECHLSALRDTFAAAALTGLIASGDYSIESTPTLAFRMADAMISQRVIAQCDKLLRNGETGYTHGISGAAESKHVTEPMPKNFSAEVSVEPAAWAVMQPDSYSVFTSRLLAVKQQELCMGGEIIPLHRQPTLTDAERLAVCYAASTLDNLPWYQERLRELMERTK
jgi:hypothetical protein